MHSSNKRLELFNGLYQNIKYNQNTLFTAYQNALVFEKSSTANRSAGTWSTSTLSYKYQPRSAIRKPSGKECGVWTQWDIWWMELWVRFKIITSCARGTPQW